MSEGHSKPTEADSLKFDSGPVRLLPPDVLIHCDWGVNARKRWLARARFRNGRYTADLAEPAGPTATLVERVAAWRGAGSALVGFDFPIGLPATYARAVKATGFVDFLRGLGRPERAAFAEVCTHAAEISHDRPFYPHAPGEKKQAHLLEALRVDHLDQLRRMCEQRQPGRRAANPLFWTLGANQTGKGVLLGWREVLMPALLQEQIRLWPYEGSLAGLLAPGTTVVAESYPTQYHRWIVGKVVAGKGDRDVRKGLAPWMLGWADQKQVTLSSAIIEEIETGFATGDDALTP